MISGVAQDANDEFWLATSPEVRDKTGQYFVSQQARPLGSAAQTKADRARLWEILERQSGVVPE